MILMIDMMQNGTMKLPTLDTYSVRQFQLHIKMATAKYLNQIKLIQKVMKLLKTNTQRTREKCGMKLMDIMKTQMTWLQMYLRMTSQHNTKRSNHMKSRYKNIKRNNQILDMMKVKAIMILSLKLNFENKSWSQIINYLN